MYLGLIWLMLIAFIIIMYVILDGFTLGVGLLFPWIRDGQKRDLMVSTVLPVWDGNETWLVFGGASLYGAFPLAFSTLLPLLYLPIMLLITGLLLRGVSFEFRLKAHLSKYVWDSCLFLGSLLAVIAQGLVVGTYIQGFSFDPIKHVIVANVTFNWFTLFCIFALIIGYTILGAGRLIKKTEGELQDDLFNVAKIMQWFLLLIMLFIGIYSPNVGLNISAWFDFKHNLFILPFLLFVIIGMVIHIYAIYKHNENLPFKILIIIFVAAYAGFISSNFPYIVPKQITFIKAQADNSALMFMLLGAAILIPLLLIYTAYAYRIFGGKVNEKISY